jgi:cytochrome b6-f complex iron-sulfur subunit
MATHIPATTSSPFVTRRQMIQVGIAALGASWLGILAQSWLFPPVDGGAAIAPVAFPLAELPVGGSKTFQYGPAPAIVIRTPESIRAFSLICTHLGCTVEWQEGGRSFYCPCHDGRFDEFGEVTAGPPPVPLESLPVQVDGDRVIVGEAA